jgi:hypothetical protein
VLGLIASCIHFLVIVRSPFNIFSNMIPKFNSSLY